jgi:hypothetical protein
LLADNADQKGPNRDKPYRPTKKNKIVAELTGLIRAYRQEQKANRDASNREDRAEKNIQRWTLGFVILTTVGIFVQAAILGHSDQTFEQTLIAQKDSSERQLRAYLGPLVPDNVADNDLIPPNTPSLHFKVRNYRLTPAYHVTKQ